MIICKDVDGTTVVIGEREFLQAMAQHTVTLFGVPLGKIRELISREEKPVPTFTLTLLPGEKDRAGDLIIENPTTKTIEAVTSYDVL
jgi:hypothetical protein